MRLVNFAVGCFLVGIAIADLANGNYLYMAIDLLCAILNFYVARDWRHGSQ